MEQIDKNFLFMKLELFQALKQQFETPAYQKQIEALVRSTPMEDTI